MNIEDSFDCIVCGNHGLEEVNCSVTFAVPILAAYSETDGDAEYAKLNPTILEELPGFEGYYRCASCHMQLPHWVCGVSSLYRYLQSPASRGWTTDGVQASGIYRFDRFVVQIEGDHRVRSIVAQMHGHYVEVMPLPDGMFEISVRKSERDFLRKILREVCLGDDSRTVKTGRMGPFAADDDAWPSA